MISVVSPNISGNEISNNKNVITKLDSADSDNFDCLTELKPITGNPVTLPDNVNICPSQQGILPISQVLSEKSAIGKVLPHLKSPTLISCKLCEDECTITLDSQKAIIKKMVKLSYKVMRTSMKISGISWLPKPT